MINFPEITTKKQLLLHSQKITGNGKRNCWRLERLELKVTHIIL
jgi:hypothetical protein